MLNDTQNHNVIADNDEIWDWIYRLNSRKYYSSRYGCDAMTSIEVFYEEYFEGTSDVSFEEFVNRIEDMITNNVDRLRERVQLSDKFYENIVEWYLNNNNFSDLHIEILRNLCGDEYIINYILGYEWIHQEASAILLDSELGNQRNFLEIARRVFLETDYDYIVENFVGYEYKSGRKNEYEDKLDNIISIIISGNQYGFDMLTEFMVEENCENWKCCYKLFYKKLFDRIGNLPNWLEMYIQIYASYEVACKKQNSKGIDTNGWCG